MPLADRTVLPSCLGRRAIAEEDQTEENSLTAVAHNAVLGTIIQLASLVRHADDIFCDLAEECQLVFEKTESINLKLHALGKKIEGLDSTEVTIRKFLLSLLLHLQHSPYPFAKLNGACQYCTLCDIKEAFSGSVLIDIGTPAKIAQ